MRASRLIVAALLILFVARPGAAQGLAAPPLGSWSGSEIILTLNPDRSYFYQDPGTSLSGPWDWRPTSAQGGVLTLHYTTPTVTQTFYNQIYFAITLVDANNIRLCEPMSGQCATLARQ